MTWMYGIIIIVVLVLYSASMTYRYLSVHAKYHRQKIHLSLHDVINEILGMIHKEDNEVDKGAYKNIGESEPKVQLVMPLYESDFVGEKAEDTSVGGPSLTNLLTAQPTDMDYERILDLLIQLFKLTYNEYKFYLAKSSDETKAPNFLQVTSPSTEHPDIHKQIFRLAVDSNMDMRELQKRFAEKAATGEVVKLGDNAVIITEDGTPQLPTGVSPVQSGLEGAEITFIISFMKAENFDEWHKNTFPEVAKDGE
jgi:hypothetical protein